MNDEKIGERLVEAITRGALVRCVSAVGEVAESSRIVGVVGDVEIGPILRIVCIDNPSAVLVWSANAYEQLGHLARDLVKAQSNDDRG